MEKTSFDRNQAIANIMKIPHGDLMAFKEGSLPTATGDPELFAHLVAWNHANGKVADSKKAFPIIAIYGLAAYEGEFMENALAHLALLNPRELVAAWDFSKKLRKEISKVHGPRRYIEQLVRQYLDAREKKVRWWQSSVMWNRKAMTTLYAVCHAHRDNDLVQKVLFSKEYPEKSVFQEIRGLKGLGAAAAASIILKRKLPMQVAIGAVSKAKDKDIVFAIIEGMSPNELVNNTKMLKQFGIFEDSTLRGAYEKALEKSKESKKKNVNMYRATKAAEVIGDEKLTAKVIQVQEAHEQKQKKIKGNALILGDCSGSMSIGIEASRHVAAAIATQVEGESTLVFFNQDVKRVFSITGKTFDQINQETKNIAADGGTDIGVGLRYAIEKKLILDLIVIISDGGERNSYGGFAPTYREYVQKFGVSPSVTLIQVPGQDPNYLKGHMEKQGTPMVTHDLGKKVDLYSIPNVIATIKPGRFDLLEEVMETPILTIKQALQMSAA